MNPHRCSTSTYPKFVFPTRARNYEPYGCPYTLQVYGSLFPTGRSSNHDPQQCLVPVKFAVPSSQRDNLLTRHCITSSCSQNLRNLPKKGYCSILIH